MNIAKHIQDLLYRYECVILPGFGAFLSQKQSAYIDEETESFYPPKKTVSFNRQLQKNDGLLANYTAEAEKVSYSNAVYAISEFAASLEKSLEEDKQADLPNIGKFVFSSENIIAFEPYNSINYFTDSFGLDSFQAGVVNREVYKEQVEEIEEKAPFLFTPERRKSSYLKYAAVGILALGLSGLAGLNIYSDQVSKHNIAEQQEAEGQLQQQIQQATFIIDNPLPAVTFNVEKQSGNYHIVAGAFRVEENAAKKVDELRAEGHKARLIGANKYGLHQVVYASHQTRRDAINMLREVKKTNESAWLLVQEL
ncbi:SPOR domain-containing protein [Zunongwangia sp. F260]|uniref:SPOR domain-containing protein n=1 Tax=Autumnicola lenta TaxID=3075593 RepID=A0ABU3CLG9_9FLAO|nr:SPOR domain-containing protein [Zunongwangia sp. F260]MDT0647192.1 SPOR domain-containing protein [Zunongwangia sp. F260]